MLSSSVCLDVFEGIANKSTLKIKHFFEKIEQAMQIVRELKEVQKLKF